jgi:hypothetical protein
MYRIELSSGEETAFRSIEELAVAIRRGVVTSKARIWHNASSKWLPIQFHPHYRQAAEMPLTKADLVAGPPVAPLGSLNLPDPNSPESRVTGFRPIDPAPQPTPHSPAPRATPLTPASPYHQPEPQLPPSPVSGLPLIEPLGGPMGVPAPLRPEPARPLPSHPRPVPFAPLPRRPTPAIKAAPPEEPPRKKKKPRARKSSRRALRAALVGALLVGGAHLGVSASGTLTGEGLRSYRRLVAVSPEASASDSPRTVAAVLPSLRNSSVPGGSKRPRGSSRPPAPTLRTPAPTLGEVTKASLPMAPAPSDSASEIQAAPAVEIPVPKATAPDSLTSAVKDSTGKKVMKGILKAVSGTAPAEQRRPKR